jgi:cell division protein FtsW
MARITSFLDPFADPTNGGFQAVRGMYALATGGLWGVGLGNSAMKWDLLPHAESDYIFAIIGEELGFLGCLVVATLYGVLAYAGFRIARRSADRFIQLASVAITVWIVGQAAMNMGYVVGLLPVTGVQLPLISAGGTSLVLTLFIVGLLARFARSEPAAIEAERSRDRGRLARLLLPVPGNAVDPVRPRRRPEDRSSARPLVGSGRTVVRSRSEPERRAAGSVERQPPLRRRPPEPGGARERIAPPRERRPVQDGARSPGRRQPPTGAPRRAGGQQ